GNLSAADSPCWTLRSPSKSSAVVSLLLPKAVESSGSTSWLSAQARVAKRTTLKSRATTSRSSSPTCQCSTRCMKTKRGASLRSSMSCMTVTSICSFQLPRPPPSYIAANASRSPSSGQQAGSSKCRARNTWLASSGPEPLSHRICPAKMVSLETICAQDIAARGHWRGCSRCALVGNLRLDQLRQESQRLLPSQIARLRRNHGRHALLHNAQLRADQDLFQGNRRLHLPWQVRVIEL